MRCKNPARDSLSVPSAGKRTLQVTWWNVDRCENAGRQGQDRCGGAAAVGGVPAAKAIVKLIQSVCFAFPHRTRLTAVHISNCRAGRPEIGFSRVSKPREGEWHPHPPFFELPKKGPILPSPSVNVTNK